jgi:DNA-binding transcriptional LysR family regulator
MCVSAQEAGMDNWDELRTAYQVARLGTVSGAAEVLGVHHATVIRHIDALEARLAVKLFQRHARGYTPTEAGRDLLAVAQAADEQFLQLANRMKGHGETVQGELIVTSISGVADLLVPVLAGFQASTRRSIVRFLTDMRLFRLDYGEAHVAIRAGNAPEEPDNVVQPLVRLKVGLYAARSYAEAHGLPGSEADFAGHRFVGRRQRGQPRAVLPLAARTGADPAADLSRQRTGGDRSGGDSGGRPGLPVGLPAQGRDDLVEVLPPRPEWESALWIVTHVDLHRTRKVQAFLAHLKEAAKGWKLCS